MKTLKPIYDRDAYADSVEQIIMYWLQETIFKPVMAVLIEPKENAKAQALERAVMSGWVHYSDGYFTGTFNAAISKELRDLGARWDKTRKAFKLDLAQLPVEVRHIIAQGYARMVKKEEDLTAKLVEIQQHLTDEPVDIDFKQRAADIISDLGKQFKKVTPADLEVPMEISEGARERLRAAYHENLNLYIKGWAQEAIFRLRLKVSDSVAQGVRAETFKKVVEGEFGVSKNKARFLARQETALLVSAYRENRFTEAGIQQYIWKTSKDERVRDSHRPLDGKVFTWINPPIVDPATGRKANPGEDFNCRCIALPVIHIGAER